MPFDDDNSSLWAESTLEFIGWTDAPSGDSYFGGPDDREPGIPPGIRDRAPHPVYDARILDGFPYV